MKNKSVNILIVSLLLLGIMSVMLIVFLGRAHENFEDGITVSADGVTESVLAVRDLKLTPTETKEYNVNLICEASGSYFIFLDYEEKIDGGMKNFVNVMVRCGDTPVYEGSLEELLNTEKVVKFEGVLEADEPLAVTICYEVPYEVSNEAQGTYADFDIHIKIEKS